MPKKRCKKAKILSLGPKDGEQLFYYHLTGLAVDYVKEMQQQQITNTAWFKVPKFLPNVKQKNVEIIVQLRIFELNPYKLDQTRLINF